MPVCTIEPGAAITAPDYRTLRLIFSRLKKLGELAFVKRFRCQKPLTRSQRKRLPAGLKRLLA
jgi:hypothetical protein